MIVVLLAIVAVAVAALYIPKVDMYKNISKEITAISTGSIYGLSGNSRVSKGHTVTRLGKLVIVKINNPESSEQYDFLRWQIATFYKFNDRVHDVYINEMGTVVVDCRPRY